MPTAVKKKKHKSNGDRTWFFHDRNRALLLILLFSLCLPWTCPRVMAANGDKLVINGSIVNVRSGPATSYPVLLKFQKGREVVELQRRDNWVEIATGRDDVVTGWIYAPLLSQADKRNVPTMKVKEDTSDPLFELFTQALRELNERIRSQTGNTYFSQVENPGNKVIRLTVTYAWSNLSREQRDRMLADVFAIWDAAVGIHVPITVDIVDRDGNRLMSKFRQ